MIADATPMAADKAGSVAAENFDARGSRTNTSHRSLSAAIGVASAIIGVSKELVS